MGAAPESELRVTLQWKEPPPLVRKEGSGSPVFTPEVLTTLRNHPNKWALIRGPTKHKGSHSQVSVWRRIYPDLEIALRSEKGGYFTYARYVGDKSPA